MKALFTHDNVRRCAWCAGSDLMRHYHDLEWGRPVDSDRRLFEKLCLEGFQCGLSWATILNKRERFREVFHGFDPDRVAAFGARDINRLLKDAGIIRHRGKIESTINNALRAIEARRAHGSLAALAWSFAPAGRQPAPRSLGDLPAKTDASTALSKALKAAGWTYVGPTTVYAFMQAVGMVNDHLVGCAARGAATAARKAFAVPAGR